MKIPKIAYITSDSILNKNTFVPNSKEETLKLVLHKLNEYLNPYNYAEGYKIIIEENNVFNFVCSELLKRNFTLKFNSDTQVTVTIKRNVDVKRIFFDKSDLCNISLPHYELIDGTILVPFLDKEVLKYITKYDFDNLPKNNASIKNSRWWKEIF